MDRPTSTQVILGSFCAVCRIYFTIKNASRGYFEIKRKC